MSYSNHSPTIKVPYFGFEDTYPESKDVYPPSEEVNCQRFPNCQSNHLTFVRLGRQYELQPTMGLSVPLVVVLYMRRRRHVPKIPRTLLQVFASTGAMPK